MADPSVSVVIPVYNGAHTIGRLVDRLMDVFKNKIFQIVLVNDGSADHSHEVLCTLAEKYPSTVTYLNLSRNFGEHNAVMAGLNHAAGDYVVIMDDDFQNPPEEALALINEAVAGKYDIVYSYYRKKQHSVLRNLGSWFHNYAAGFMLQKPKDLYLSTFKCLSKFVVQEIIKYTGPFPYIDGLALRSTLNIGRLEVRHDKREVGKSGYTFRKLIKLWFNIFVNYSFHSQRLSFLVGLFCSCMAVIFGLVVIKERIRHPELPLGWASILPIIFFIVGIQFIIFGILGKYLGRLFWGRNQKPQYIIRESYGRTKKD